MKLSPTQQAIYNLLKQRRDVSIEDLFAVLGHSNSYENVGARRAQMLVGAQVAWINKKITGERVVPADIKRHYRLVPV